MKYFTSRTSVVINGVKYCSAFQVSSLLGVNNTTLCIKILKGEIEGAFYDAETKKYRVPESYIKLAIESQLRDGG